MRMMIDLSPYQSRQGVKLDTLVRLRWLAVAGQSLAVVIVAYGLGYTLPTALCAALILLSAVLNIVLSLRYPANYRLSNPAAAALLAYDILQLAALLYFTGGLTNPFAVLLIAPVMVSATALGLGYTVGLGGLVTLLATLLALFFQPLPWEAGDALQMPGRYVLGIWFAVISALGFMGVYAFRIADEARQLQAALTATELILAREQHLHQLDGLAAAAAHELGTPLATIILVVRELEREMPPQSPWREDISLLRSQSERCREILGKLTSLSTDSGGALDQLPISILLEDVVAPHREFGVLLFVHLNGTSASEPVGSRNPAILYGLGSIVENAVDFAKSRVDVGASWSEDEVLVTISDDGPGFASDIVLRLGEPYVTSRGWPRAARANGGLGLGFFIAKTLLERSGARVSVANRAPPDTGAVVTIRWPRKLADGAARPTCW